MRPLLGVLAGACAAAVIACASGQRSASQPMATTTGVSNSPVMPPGTHDQIAALDRKIAEQRREMKLPEPPPMAPTAVPSSTMPVVACPAAPPDTCQDVCKLSDSICENAAKICELAKQMPGDDWASGKCASANVTCTDAHERCCGCQ